MQRKSGSRRQRRRGRGSLRPVHGPPSPDAPDGVALAHRALLDEHERLKAELALFRERLVVYDRLSRVGELASGVAHDVSNALNALRLRLELVRPDEARGAENLAAMRRALADAILRLASLQDAGSRPAPTHHDVSLRRVARDAVALFRPAGAAAERPLDVRLALPDVRLAGASAVELRHLLLNLLLNARDAMPVGGLITIEAEQTTRGVVVRVTDGGGGIPAAILPRLFEPFVTTKARPGHGLGLFTARTLMTRLGGSIVAENHPAGGAVITITFPRTVGRAAKVARRGA